MVRDSDVAGGFGKHSIGDVRLSLSGLAVKRRSLKEEERACFKLLC